ncbi:MAG: serine/threonine protein kinase, partial [Acidimicrobiales bacterium]|nr:serine/threonine protein kinase [Acidimicrobiales bacterium]
MEVAGFDDLVEIGRGASAIVYRAHQVAFDRTVALKVLVTPGLDGDARRRFDRECRTVGRLGWHPRVVPVFDTGTTPLGHPYLAMELLGQGSLATRLREQGTLPPEDVVAVGIQVADALQAAHAEGVLHRDVKPGNILVGHFDDVKLADFGIAAVSSSSTSVTDALAGTFSYLAPELLDGGRATPGADVYSLGATLYTLLTGRLAYAAGTDDTPMAVLMRIARDPVPDLRVAGIDDDLATVIERAMAKDPAERAADAASVLAGLAAVAATAGWPPVPTYAHRRPGAPPAAAAV